jgi:hypothetical protein
LQEIRCGTRRRRGRSFGVSVGGTRRRRGRSFGVSVGGTRRRHNQCPKRFLVANMPWASKKARASSTLRKIFVAVSVMNGLGFFFGFQTT